MITKIESLLDEKLAKARGNEDVCSDIFGSQKSKILADRISAVNKVDERGWGWELSWNKRL
jgi:hypothetical protein